MLLEVFAQGLAVLSKPVHPTLFPFPLGPTIHAARISTAYQAQARAAASGNGPAAKLPWGTYIAGYLIMAWGGTILTHHLLSLPPPMLYSPTPYLIYIPVHLLLTFLFSLFPGLLSPSSLALLDTALFPLDALVRTGSVTGALAHLSTHDKVTVHPALAASPLTHLLIGALAAAGGSLLASTLSTWSANWSFSTPPVLRAPTLWAGVDLWGGALAAGVYGAVTGHVAFDGVRGVVGREGKWTEGEGKALCAIVLVVCAGARVYKVHWAAGNRSSEKTQSKPEGEKGKKE